MVVRSVDKFGGSSMATPESIRQVAEIIVQQRLQVVVVSAPGKMNGAEKVTDLLVRRAFREVFDRLRHVIYGLGLTNTQYDLLSKELISRIRRQDHMGCVAFGEYASARILTWYLEGVGGLKPRFVDAVDLVFFTGSTVHIKVDPSTGFDRPCIVPGFYGTCLSTQRIRLFPRGGSDITGAYLAAALKASLYQNWTDVDGVYTRNPRTGIFPEIYASLSYGALERLYALGAEVFHGDAVAPVRGARIPTRIRNTFAPHHTGTLVIPDQ